MSIFADHGPVSSASIVTYKDSGRSRGFGFVVLSEGQASRALTAVDGRNVRGRKSEGDQPPEPALDRSPARCAI